METMCPSVGLWGIMCTVVEQTLTEFFPKLCVVVPACDLSTWKVQAGRLGIRGHPWL